MNMAHDNLQFTINNYIFSIIITSQQRVSIATLETAQGNMHIDKARIRQMERASYGLTRWYPDGYQGRDHAPFA